MTRKKPTEIPNKVTYTLRKSRGYALCVFSFVTLCIYIYVYIVDRKKIARQLTELPTTKEEE